MVEVVAALIWDKGKFLICRRPENKARGLLWEFVGGKVEKGETKQHALKRECMEELNIEVEPKDVFITLHHEYPDIDINLTLFNAVIIGGEMVLNEHKEVKWITPDEIGLYEFCPADGEILKKLEEL